MKYRSDFRLVIGVPDLDVVNCFTLYHCLIRALRSCHCKSAFRPIYIYTYIWHTLPFLSVKASRVIVVTKLGLVQPSENYELDFHGHLFFTTFPLSHYSSVLSQDLTYTLDLAVLLIVWANLLL